MAEWSIAPSLNLGSRLRRLVGPNPTPSANLLRREPFGLRAPLVGARKNVHRVEIVLYTTPSDRIAVRKKVAKRPSSLTRVTLQARGLEILCAVATALTHWSDMVERGSEAS